MTKAKLIELLLDDCSPIEINRSFHVSSLVYNIAGMRVELLYTGENEGDPDIEVDGEMID